MIAFNTINVQEEVGLMRLLTTLDKFPKTFQALQLIPPS